MAGTAERAKPRAQGLSATSCPPALLLRVGSTWSLGPAGVGDSRDVPALVAALQQAGKEVADELGVIVVQCRLQLLGGESR